MKITNLPSPLRKASAGLIAASLALTIAGCSKSDEASQPGQAQSKAASSASTVLSEPLLSLVSANSLAFAVGSLEGDAAKRWVKGLKKETSLADTLNQIAEGDPDLAQLQTLAKFLVDQKIDKTSNLIAQGIKGSALWVEKAATTTPDAAPFKGAAVWRFGSEFKAAEFLEALKKTVTEIGAKDGVQVAELAADALPEGAKGFKVDGPISLKVGLNPNSNRFATVVGDGDLKTLLSQELKTPEASQIPCPDLENLKKNMPVDENSVDFFCVNIPAIAAAAKESNPEAQNAEKVTEYIKSLAGSTRIDSAPNYVLAMQHTGKEFLAAQGTKQGSELLNGLPADSVVALSIDGGFIKSAINAVPAEQQGAMTAEDKARIEKLSSFALGIRPNQMAPFPDLMFRVATSEDPAGLQAKLKNDLGGAVAMGGAPAWQTETIEGVETQGLMTPFGVGIFTAVSGNNLLVSSSKEGLKQLILNKDGDALGQGKAKDMLSRSNSVFVVYFDAPNVAKTIESAASSLAMFTGGQPPLDQAAIKRMTETGLRTVLASNDGQFIKIVLSDDLS